MSCLGSPPSSPAQDFVTVGVAILRRKIWTDLGRVLPALLGSYTLLVLIPVMIGTGGPPAPAALWIIAIWDVLWCALAANLVLRSRVGLPIHPTEAKVVVR